MCMKTKRSEFSRASAFMACLLFCPTTLTEKVKTFGLPLFLSFFCRYLYFIHLILCIQKFICIYIFLTVQKSFMSANVTMICKLTLMESLHWVGTNTCRLLQGHWALSLNCQCVHIYTGNVTHYLPASYSLLHLCIYCLSNHIFLRAGIVS